MPPDLDELVMACLQRDASHRLRSARDAAVKLAMVKSQRFPSHTGFELQEVIRELWDGDPPRLLPDPEQDAFAETRARARPSAAADDPPKPQSVGEQTAAALAEAAARQYRHVRQDSTWLSPIDRTKSARPPRESDLHTRTTELEIERPPLVPARAIAPSDDIDQLKRLFMADPNLWVLFDIGRAYARREGTAAALGAFKLAAAKFAQGGLLVQAACIYRYILDEFGTRDAVRAEIRRLPSLQGRSTADLLIDTLDDHDPATDFSEYANIFEEDAAPVEVFHESPILASLNAEQFLSFVEAVSLDHYPGAHQIVTEGATGDSFFLLGRAGWWFRPPTSEDARRTSPRFATATASASKRTSPASPATPPSRPSARRW